MTWHRTRSSALTGCRITASFYRRFIETRFHTSCLCHYYRNNHEVRWFIRYNQYPSQFEGVLSPLHGSAVLHAHHDAKSLHANVTAVISCQLTPVHTLPNSCRIFASALITSRPSILTVVRNSCSLWRWSDACEKGRTPPCVSVSRLWHWPWGAAR